jgi:manganese/iron transport system permease protein
MPEYLLNAILAGLFAGTACSLVGAFVVTMHLSSLGVCISHAAFAGALMGVWLGFEPLIGALLFSLGASAIIGPLADGGDLSPDASIGIIFSLMIGLAFLFLGLTPGAHAEALTFFWGGILTVSRFDLAFLGVTAFAVAAGFILFNKEIHATACHRHVAVAIGVPATFVFYSMLFATGLTIAVSLRGIGGLLIYSLVINPAASAMQLTYRFNRMLALSIVFGVGACWIGLAASYFWNLPAGAAIVISSSLLFGLSTLFSPKKRNKH